MLKALCGMPISSSLYYKTFREDVEAIVFELNPFNICAANQIKTGKQKTFTCHVDDFK